MIHGDIVDEFTENFCKHVGIKYGCAVDCATNAIFLVASEFPGLNYRVPTIMTPVVPQAFIQAGVSFQYTDNVSWVGHAYCLNPFDKMRIIDSAQAVNAMHNYIKNDDIAIFSFYPTKPVGSSDGGMICSNNKSFIDRFKILSVQGTMPDVSSWNGRRYVDVGWKMYMNSFQAYIANENLKKLPEKLYKLENVCDQYNDAFKYENSSHHLYRIRVSRQNQFMHNMRDNGIACGIHYDCCHGLYVQRNPQNKYSYYTVADLPKSCVEASHTVSIPFHEKLTEKEISKVIKCIKSTKMLLQRYTQ
jgi:dTDP-4-amino-4,6-dideoxygalactose transaminase